MGTDNACAGTAQNFAKISGSIATLTLKTQTRPNPTAAHCLHAVRDICGARRMILRNRLGRPMVQETSLGKVAVHNTTMTTGTEGGALCTHRRPKLAEAMS